MTSYTRIQTKISKTKFPEICPVCLQEVEDIVSVTIQDEKWSGSHIYGFWGRAPAGGLAIPVQEGKAVTFWIPTCLLHGSDTVRTSKTRLVTVIAFFLLFYPLLYMALQINVELSYGRSINDEITWLIILVSGLIISILYGYFPRALERAVSFENVDLVRDVVVLRFSNHEYAKLFLQLNEMYTSDLDNVEKR